MLMAIINRRLTMFTLVLLLCRPFITLAGDDLEERHIIDWHVHVAGLGHGGSGAFVNQSMRGNFRFGLFLKWMQVTEAELREHGDALVVERLSRRIDESRYVDQAVVLAIDGVYDRDSGTLDRDNTQFYVPNDYVYAQTSRFDNLLFGASINPWRSNSLELLEQVAKQGAVLIKWIPSIMDIDPADEALIPFYRKMAELGLPLLSHTGRERAFVHARDEFSDPQKLALPLRLGVLVIAAHISTTGVSEGEDNFERILPMFDQYPNLYTDISSLTQINKTGFLVRALNVPGVSERMIYGSDWPLQSFPVVSPWYHVRHTGIKEAWRINGIKNKWDRDIRLKSAMGVPDEVFSRRPCAEPADCE